jgi:ABC-type polysaccharide/polyol phosphate export permease
MNPMTALVGACQDVLVAGRAPDAAALATPALIALVLCLLALWLVRRRAGEMVDEL